MIVESIQKLCDERKMPLSALESKLGFSRGAIYKWHKSSPKVDSIKKIADYFKVSIDSLLGKTFVIEPNNETEQIMKVISNPDNIPYILISAEAKEKGLSSKTLKQLIDIFTEQNKKG